MMAQKPILYSLCTDPPPHPLRKNRREGGGVCTPANPTLIWVDLCLVPVRCFLSPSRSIHFGDVSEANSHFRSDHVTRNALAARNNADRLLGQTSNFRTLRIRPNSNFSPTRLNIHCHTNFLFISFVRRM